MDQVERKRMQQDLEKAVRSLRNDPERWKKIRSRFLAAKSDDERVEMMVDFVTDESSLRRLLPKELNDLRGGPVGEKSLITTIIFIDSAY